MGDKQVGQPDIKSSNYHAWTLKVPETQPYLICSLLEKDLALLVTLTTKNGDSYRLHTRLSEQYSYASFCIKQFFGVLSFVRSASMIATSSRRSMLRSEEA